MDLSDPGVLMSGFLISMVGLGLFMHGKKMEKLRSLGIGVVLMVLPIFVHSLLVLWLIAGTCVAGALLLPDGS